MRMSIVMTNSWIHLHWKCCCWKESFKPFL